MFVSSRAFLIVLVYILAVVSTPAFAGVSTETFGGRDLLVYTPAKLPLAGTRALVVVLHGGLGNASRIEGAGGSEKGLNMDALAEKFGFIVAYLNGTPVTRRLGADKLGWNAGGGCCGVPAENNVDDVAYISATVNFLTTKFGIARARVFGIGHSNGAMMTQRILCETDLYAAGVAVSGPLNLHVASCPAARGKRILAIHGADDQNVPVAGGRGSAGLARVDYASEAAAQQIFTASGADYRVQIIPGVAHNLEAINNRFQQTEGMPLAEKAARFFGLAL